MTPFSKNKTRKHKKTVKETNKQSVTIEGFKGFRPQIRIPQHKLYRFQTPPPKKGKGEKLMNKQTNQTF